MALPSTDVPPILKAIRPYLKIAVEHSKRDPVVTYWCTLYALQTGLKIDSRSKDCFTFLTGLIDWLEKEKKVRSSDDAVTNEVVAQAHMENYALKLFFFADSEDREGKFSKNLVKTFYTASLLFDSIATFGEPSEEITHHNKYAKWKATYINNCLTQGITPNPGPMPQEDGQDDFGNPLPPPPNPTIGFNFPSVPSAGGSSSMPPNAGGYTSQPSSTYPTFPNVNPSPSVPPANSSAYFPPDYSSGKNQLPPEPEEEGPKLITPTGVKLTSEDVNTAIKHCKWAGSALQYEDVPTAVENLQKALALLTTGQK